MVLFILAVPVSVRAEEASDDDVAPSLIQIPELPDDVGSKKSSSASGASSAKKSSSRSSSYTSTRTRIQPVVQPPASGSGSNRYGSSGSFPWGKKPSRASAPAKVTKPSASAQKTAGTKPSAPAPSSAPVLNVKNTSSSSSAVSNSASQQGTRRGRSKAASPSSKGASADLPAKVVIGQPREIYIVAKGRSYPVSIRTTGIEDEYLVPADSSGIKSVASAFGASQFGWNDGQGCLEGKAGKRSLSLKSGQMQLPSSIGGRSLDVGITDISGKPYFPISILEDLLEVRVTIDQAKGKGWVEPLISSVRLEGSGRNLSLNIKTTSPVTFSTFKLAQPNRYVIDVVGGVIDTSSLRLNHPELGDIRLGQFSLGPAVSRIVVPTTADVKVTPPASSTGSDFKFGLELPRADVGQTFAKEKVLDYSVSGSKDSSGASTSIVTLNFSGPIQYEWRRLTEGGDRFMLDLKRVVFADNKVSRRIDGALVKNLRISQYASSPVPVTRVVLDLNKSVGVSVRSGSGASSLVLEISNQVVDTRTAVLSGEGAIYGTPVIGGAKTICIDPGHGGSDSGCVSSAYGYMEKDVTFDISNKLAVMLRSRGWNVVLTRESDRDVTWAGSSNTEELGARVDAASNCNADIFVSIHCNAAASSAAEGTSVHVYKRGDRALAECIYPALLKSSGRMDRGIQQDRFFVLVHTRMPSVLVETAFLSNPSEAQLLGDPEYRRRIAQGLADGICEYGAKYLRK